MSAPRSERAGNATPLAAAKRLTTTGRVLPVVIDRLFDTEDRRRFDNAVDIVGFRRQVPFIEGPESIGVHLNSALGLSNEPGPPQ